MHETLICYIASDSVLHRMTDSPKRSHADTSDVELETRQLTLEDWADSLRAIPGLADTPAQGSANSDAAAATVTQDDETTPPHAETGRAAATHRPSAPELLETPGALLTRSHLRELGLERRAIDAVFRRLAVVFLPGYSRPMVRVEDYLKLIKEFTYRDDRVRPIAKAS
jgi:hypothetical protein